MRRASTWRLLLYTMVFVFMMLVAAIDFVLFIDRWIPLRGRFLPFLTSLVMVVLGGYVSMNLEIGLDETEKENGVLMGLVVSGIILMLFFLL
ncbi:hypothetical protein [Thermococcus sp.]